MSRIVELSFRVRAFIAFCKVTHAYLDLSLYLLYAHNLAGFEVKTPEGPGAVVDFFCCFADGDETGGILCMGT